MAGESSASAFRPGPNSCFTPVKRKRLDAESQRSPEASSAFNAVDQATKSSTLLIRSSQLTGRSWSSSCLSEADRPSAFGRPTSAIAGRIASSTPANATLRTSIIAAATPATATCHAALFESSSHVSSPSSPYQGHRPRPLLGSTGSGLELPGRLNGPLGPVTNTAARAVAARSSASETSSPRFIRVASSGSVSAFAQPIQPSASVPVGSPTPAPTPIWAQTSTWEAAPAAMEQLRAMVTSRSYPDLVPCGFPSHVRSSGTCADSDLGTRLVAGPRSYSPSPSSAFTPAGRCALNSSLHVPAAALTLRFASRSSSDSEPGRGVGERRSDKVNRRAVAVVQVEQHEVAGHGDAALAQSLPSPLCLSSPSLVFPLGGGSDSDFASEVGRLDCSDSDQERLDGGLTGWEESLDQSPLSLPLLELDKADPHWPLDDLSPDPSKRRLLDFFTADC